MTSGMSPRVLDFIRFDVFLGSVRVSQGSGALRELSTTPRIKKW